MSEPETAATTAAAEPQPEPGGGAATPPPPLRTRGLTKRYGDLVAVDDLTLELRRGEIFGLLGQNGAGKTTTILMLLGLTEPSAGRARVLGLDPARRPREVKRRVGYLPDAVGFYGNMTGRENLRYTARLNGLAPDAAEPRIAELLTDVGMSDRADDLTETYSRGMLQRLGIADALVKSPEILILDEPTTAIDPIGVIEILDLLRRLSRDLGITILLSSHLLNQVQSVCDRIGIFAYGRLIGLGTVAELAARFDQESVRIEVGFDAAEGVDEVAERDRIAAALAGIAGVRRATGGTSPTAPWTVEVEEPEIEPRVRREILALAAATGLGLSSIRSVMPSLEDIYRSAVERRGGRLAA
jgi:ABC-2 type transport system ATP-binding protein